MPRSLKKLRTLLLSISFSVTCVSEIQAQSVARGWNEQALDLVRVDFPAPTVHARNLFHLSAAMYDAWAAYDSQSVGIFHNEVATVPGIANPTAAELQAARNEAVSYAAFRILLHRDQYSASIFINDIALRNRMSDLGFDPFDDSLIGDSPAAVGNRVGNTIINSNVADGANEINTYADTSNYATVNGTLKIFESGPGVTNDPNRWQPLEFEVAQTQNDLEASPIQVFVDPHWGYVTPFAITGEAIDGVYSHIDPGMPPLLGGAGDADFKEQNIEVIELSAKLDPVTSGDIDISPAAQGNNPLGTNDGSGYALNPETGLPYASNSVNHADYGRAIAEFWADGPDSETPPGHWNVIANEISEHPNLQRRIEGTGNIVDELEWDVKLYVCLNAALHDAAIAAWGVKAKYDYIRPISSIRYMGSLGQSSDSTLPSYHPSGLPLKVGSVELVTASSSATGERHEGLTPGKIAIYSWQGEPNNTATQTGGVGWIHADNWLPYQRDTFVTPAFAGYVSGHSAFSRAAAEVLTLFTGDEYFPGGIGTHLVPMGSLDFEFGPSQDLELQWATYYDAADQAGLSRLYGGIHVAPDDGPGRVMGSLVGKSAYSLIRRYLNGSILTEFASTATVSGDDIIITWSTVADYEYKVQTSTSLAPETFMDLTSYSEVDGKIGSYTDPGPMISKRFYRIMRQAVQQSN